MLRLGVGDDWIPHGNPDRILARLGLDADGIATAVAKALAAPQDAGAAGDQ